MDLMVRQLGRMGKWSGPFRSRLHGRQSQRSTVAYFNGMFFSTSRNEAQLESPLVVSTAVGHDKVYQGKIVKLVDEISQLTLLEVGDLNELLKKRLNIPDTPMMTGMMMAAGSAQNQPKEEAEEVAPVRVQTQFTVKLLKYDETKKVALIKEVKALLEGMNLVQAKKFVESSPTTVKADIPKEDAEKLAAALTAAGATCEVI